MAGPPPGPSARPGFLRKTRGQDPCHALGTLFAILRFFGWHGPCRCSAAYTGNGRAMLENELYVRYSHTP